MALLFGEFFAVLFLLGQPDLKVGFDPLGKGDQFVLLLHGKAHQGDQVGEDASAGRAPHLVFCKGRLGLPELGFAQPVGRGLDALGQGFDVLEPEPLFIRSEIENLQGRNFIFVLLDELFEGCHHAPGPVKGFFAEARFDDLALADTVDGDLVFALDIQHQLARLGIA